MKINKERAIYLAAVSQTIAAAQFGFFALTPLENLLKSKGLPDLLEVVIISTTVYLALFLAGYLVLSNRFTKE